MDSQHAKFDGPHRPRSFPGRARAELPCRGCGLGPIRLIVPVSLRYYPLCSGHVGLGSCFLRTVPYAAQRASSYFVLLA